MHTESKKETKHQNKKPAKPDIIHEEEMMKKQTQKCFKH